MTFALVAILTGQKEEDYGSDYDLRFVCGLKLDINELPLNIKIKNNSEEKKLNKLSTSNCYITNSKFKIYKNHSSNHLEEIKFLYSTIFKDYHLRTYNQTYLFSPRSPPFRLKPISV